jgi:hypothetical protein
LISGNLEDGSGTGEHLDRMLSKMIEDGDERSSIGMSARSYKYGITFSGSDITGTSYSGFMWQ